jgi:hypothetical protein
MRRPFARSTNATNVPASAGFHALSPQRLALGIASNRMLRHVGSPALRLIIAPASVAAFAALGLQHVGTLPALGAGWLVFVLCVLATGAWGKFQLARTRHRLQTRTRQRSSRTR